MRTFFKSKRVVAVALTILMLAGFVPTGLFLVSGQAAGWAGSAESWA